MLVLVPIIVLLFVVVYYYCLKVALIGQNLQFFIISTDRPINQRRIDGRTLLEICESTSKKRKKEKKKEALKVTMKKAKIVQVFGCVYIYIYTYI